MQDDLLRLVSVRRGHFALESGHHGDVWLDLDLLLLRPQALRPFAVALAERLAVHRVEMVCGPLTGGALVAALVAAELDAEFCFTERVAHQESDALYPVEYRLPESLKARVRGKRVAIVDDAVTAGSAIRGTYASLASCGAETVAFGALLLLSKLAVEFAASKGLPLEHIASLPSQTWAPAQCPLCAAGVPLEHADTRPD